MNNVLVLDVENSVTFKPFTKRDGKPTTITQMLPFTPTNHLVSIGTGENTEDIYDTDYFCFYHKEKYLDEGAFEAVQKKLDKTDLLIGHNIKHDLHWLRACGFKYRGKVWDTGIAEYVLCRGVKRPLKLKLVVERYGLPSKKTDLTEDYLADGVGFESMPWGIVEEYGRGDITATMALYLKQLELLDIPENRCLKPTVEMMCAFTNVVEEMEYNGLNIDFDALAKVEKDYVAELHAVKTRLLELAANVMGDTPIRLSSNDFMSELLYSRKVKDKNRWKTTFNIGKDFAGRDLLRPRMAKSKFNATVRAQTDVIKRTDVKHCSECEGRGYYQKHKKDGTPWKNTTKCPKCLGEGYVYIPNGRVAGFKLVPDGVKYVSASGFSGGKDVLASLLEVAKGDAREFLEKMVRFNAISSYLSSFVDGIRKYAEEDNLLHPSLNQMITATARLSSSNPNFQNQPRGNTFPVRRAVASRFPGGQILEFDYAQLEFRIAGYLSGCKVLLDFIRAGEDAHAVTRDTMNEFDPELPQIDRQEAKPHCFPLDTEILTVKGWKKYNEIKVGDIVINYDSNAKTLVQDTVIDYTAPHNQEVISMSHKHNWEVKSTPEHRWYCEKRVDKGKRGRMYEPKVVRTKDINSEHRIITSAWYNSSGTCSDNTAAVLGWLWTDGHERKEYARIVQKKYKQEIIDLLDEGKYSVYELDNGCAHYGLRRQYIKDLYVDAGLDYLNVNYEQFILSLSSSARTAWLNAVLLAEGTVREGDTWRVAQNSGALCEAIKLAAFLSGYDIRVTYTMLRTGKQHEQITLRNRPYVTGQRIIKKSCGVQQVWCVTTNNHTVVIKQGDTITISGQTFKPLYGGMSGTPREKHYYKSFLERFPGVATWQTKLENEALSSKRVRLPSGREYEFPYVKRLASGYVQESTKIKNYPVQGFATGDIVPLSALAVHRAMQKEEGLKSLLILTVHDSLVVDVYPGEEQLMQELMAAAMLDIPALCKEFYDIDFEYPLSVEGKMGPNWLDTKVIGEYNNG